MEITKVIVTYIDLTTVTYEVGVASVVRVTIGPKSTRLVVDYGTYKLLVTLNTVKLVAIYE